jgi:formylglycine-generating enzyme required for sulfatase activity
MKTITTLAACALALAATNSTIHADTFGSGLNTFTIDFASVGNAGNGSDVNNPYPNGGDGGTPYGGVAYNFRIGTYEISQDQIDKATASGLTNVTAGYWAGLQPAAQMTWYEAAAFANWLNTSTGHQAAYNLTQIAPDIFGNTWSMAVWSSGDAWQAGGENLYRHKDAYYFLPSEDEWYKAAYHKNDGVTANYWDYATGSNDSPAQLLAGGTTPGFAVYGRPSGPPENVDNDGGLSPYGTRGQNGNILEWVESAFDGVNDSVSELRPVRGGFWQSGEHALRSSFRDSDNPATSNQADGFRVASVPEPSVAFTLTLGIAIILATRRHQQPRRARA